LNVTDFILYILHKKEETMDLGFKDKVALITGTASQIGIGKTIALTLAREGCDIIGMDMDLEGAEKTAAEIKALGRKANAFKANVGIKAEVGDAVKKALKEFGKIDILVNTAGGTSRTGPLVESAEEAWEQDINTNLYGTMNCSKAVLPQMIERRYGKIVNFASIAMKIFSPKHGVSYGIAKAAVVALTMKVAVEVGASGINVNCIAPGGIPTNFQRLDEKGINEFKQREIPKTPIGRLTTTQDIANTVAFLTSDISSAITGQLIVVDGGRTLM
jgi:NAD(P)-dependent dehydrogenase (short-subunit alcohol dehydrogenase family)